MDKPTYGPKEVFVYQGPTGTGKSREVWEREDPEFTEDKLYVVADNYWWDGYRGQEAVLFEEFTGQWKIEWLLRVLDRYPMRVPFKGGFVPLKAKRIYFTSNKMWQEWYPIGVNGVSAAQLDALERRFTEVRDF